MLGLPGRQQRLNTPRHIERYLLDEEVVVLAVRRHPIVVAEPVITAVVGLLLVAVASEAVPAHLPLVQDVLWWTWFAVVGRALWRFAEYHNDWFIGTDRRLLLTYGVITRKVAMMPLAKVTDLSYNRSVAGRVLGYGKFVLESAGQDQAMRTVDFLPSPDELYRRICGQIFQGPVKQRIPNTGAPVLVGPGTRTPEGPGGAGASADAPPERPRRGRDHITEEVDVSDLRQSPADWDDTDYDSDADWDDTDWDDSDQDPVDPHRDSAGDEPRPRRRVRRTIRRYTEHHNLDPGDD